MNKNIYISFFLDKRREKANKKFPLKIRVFQTNPRKQKLLSTKYDLTEKEYNAIFYPIKGERVSIEISSLRGDMSEILKKANAVADSIVPFNFEMFEKKLYSKKSQQEDVFYQYDVYIKKLKDEGRIKTASNYECSKNALINFQKFRNIKSPELLDFRSVSRDFLNDFERYFMIDLKRSIASVGAYTRPLRVIYNKAIAEKIINNEHYPFGKGGFIIPSSAKVKKALTSNQLKTLFNATPLNKEQEQAKDFWFLSFSCNGINIKDLCLLRNEDVDSQKFQFIRAKTKNSKRINSRPIEIFFNDYSKRIFEKYSVKLGGKKDFVFGIINTTLSTDEKVRRIDNFNRFVSQHIKQLAISVGLDSSISTIWARHSFATTLMRNGGNLELAQECLGHSSKRTTENYFSGFASETHKELSNSIMDFNK